MNKEELMIELAKLNISLSDMQIKQIEEFCQFLMVENKKYNLTAIKEYEEILLKHVYDSLTIVKAIDLKNCENLLDIGSGAGFPGLILKIAFPHLNITLLDANGKKTHFLELSKALLKLDGLFIVNARAESYIKNHRDKFDVVTARAVANINILIELGIPFVKENKFFIAMKGRLENELDLGREACQFLDCEITEIIEFNLPKEKSKRTLVLIKKQGKTSKEYPRTYDKILKKPLKIKLK